MKNEKCSAAREAVLLNEKDMDPQVKEHLQTCCECASFVREQEQILTFTKENAQRKEPSAQMDFAIRSAAVFAAQKRIRRKNFLRRFCTGAAAAAVFAFTFTVFYERGTFRSGTEETTISKTSGTKAVSDLMDSANEADYELYTLTAQLETVTDELSGLPANS